MREAGKSPTAIAIRGPELPAPPILAGRHTDVAAAQVARFYGAVASIFEFWVTRRESPHTQRAYRDDVMAFARFLGWTWSDHSDAAPSTINRRISSLSSFYKYLGGGAPSSACRSSFRTGTCAVRSALLERYADRDKSAHHYARRQLIHMPAGDSGQTPTDDLRKRLPRGPNFDATLSANMSETPIVPEFSVRG